MHLKLNDFEKGLIQEISDISGYPVSNIREVLEFVLVRQIEEYLSDGEISIPFIGKGKIDYIGENYKEGCREANIKMECIPSELFKRLIGDCVDGEANIIRNLLEKKIASSLMNSLQEEK